MDIQTKCVAVPESPIINVEGTKVVRTSTITPRCILFDGTSLSIQYHSGAYITGRPNQTKQPSVIKTDDIVDVEIGYPSRVIKEIIGYAEDPESPLDTVYPYVPVWLVDRIISQRGGIVRFEDTQKIYTTGVE